MLLLLEGWLAIRRPRPRLTSQLGAFTGVNHALAGCFQARLVEGERDGQRRGADPRPERAYRG